MLSSCESVREVGSCSALKISEKIVPSGPFQAAPSTRPRPPGSESFLAWVEVQQPLFSQEVRSTYGQVSSSGLIRGFEEVPVGIDEAILGEDDDVDFEYQWGSTAIVRGVDCSV